MCVVVFDNNVLNVTIYLNKEHKDYSIGDCFISQENGIVSRVDVKSGRALVKKGDIVKKGDKLIEGSYIDYEENVVEVIPQGSIYAKVYKHQNVIIPKKAIRKKYEKTKNMYSFYAFGRKIYSNIKSDSNLAQFISSISTYNAFALKINRVECYKIHCVEYEIDEMELNEIIANEQQSFIENYSAKASIINVRVIKKEIDNCYFIDIYYELEQCISIEEV